MVLIAFVEIYTVFVDAPIKPDIERIKLVIKIFKIRDLFNNI